MNGFWLMISLDTKVIKIYCHSSLDKDFFSLSSPCMIKSACIRNIQFFLQPLELDFLQMFELDVKVFHYLPLFDYFFNSMSLFYRCSSFLLFDSMSLFCFYSSSSPVLPPSLSMILQGVDESNLCSQRFCLSSCTCKPRAEPHLALPSWRPNLPHQMHSLVLQSNYS